MKILRVKKSPIYDVFQGEGWENWSRIIVFVHKTVRISGEPLTNAQLRSLTNTIKNIPQE